MILTCISNSLDDVKSCVVRDQHLSACDGWAYRTHDGHAIRTARECDGCLPRPASVGLLCWSCSEKFTAALDVTVDVITHCRSVDRGPADGAPVRSAPGSRVILPASWIQADDLLMQLLAVAYGYARDWGVPELEADVTGTISSGFHPEAPIDAVIRWVEHIHDYVQRAAVRLTERTTGAAEAVRYTRQVQRALTAFPMEEKPRRLPYIRCRVCDNDSLIQRPPLEFLDPIVIDCSTPGCDGVWDPDLIEWDLRVMREEIENAVKAKQKAGTK